jgi:hypothetical protein
MIYLSFVAFDMSKVHKDSVLKNYFKFIFKNNSIIYLTVTKKPRDRIPGLFINHLNL